MEGKTTDYAVITAERVTRQLLREMRNGERVIVMCKDGYDLDSQKNTAYAMSKMENCKFRCRSNGLMLTVMKSNIN